MGRNNADLHGIAFETHTTTLNTIVKARHPEHGLVGELGLSGGTMLSPSADGMRVMWLDVHPNHRRKGIATGMWNYAKQQGYNPVHSSQRTPDGEAWAKSLDGPLPENRLEPEKANPNFSQWKGGNK